jgi:hypothetical protein
MIDPMQTMEAMNDFNNDIFYGWITNWSDYFLRSCVKQKNEQHLDVHHYASKL